MKSESIKNLMTALNKAQSEFNTVELDSFNPFYKSKYASIESVMKAIKDGLSNNGLTISQPAVSNEFGVGVTTILYHVSGEHIESTITIPISPSANTAQEAGKGITYLRRYSLTSILNLFGDEDTDGNDDTQSSNKSSKTTQKASSTQKKLNTPMSLEMAESITGSDAIRYGDCTSAVLDKKMIGISKGLNKKDITDQQRETYLLKRDAILTINAHRVQG